MTGTRSETGLTATTGALAAAAAVLLVVVGIVLVQQGTGSGDTGAGSGDSPSATDGATHSASPSEGAGSTAPAGSSEPEEPWVAEAVRAAEDGFPAFVPSEVPRDWTVDVATYESDTTWRMELTSATGAQVVIDQRSGDDVEPGVRDAVGDTEQSGSVNLRRWGTGVWPAYQGNDAHALAQRLAGTAVVVSGADRAEVVELTKQLLTAEMVVNVGDGSDG